MTVLHTAGGDPLARTRGTSFRPSAVMLEKTALEGEDPNRVRDDAVWIQVAIEGEYKGYRSGPFKLTKADFEQMVGNFRSHPGYVAGEDGLGVADVIPFDFHHESEKSGGPIAVVGAPAQAWALDLEVRDGTSAAELWALTRYLEPALTYVREGKYKWTSIVAWPDCVHPVTGQVIGWYISSIAFTNDPFIQGMAPIAAEREAMRRPLSLGDDSKELDTDAIMQDLRWMLGLTSTAGIVEVAAELAKLETMMAGEPPAGVDLPAIVSQLRWLLRLPLLTPAGEVLTQMRELLARLAAATVPETDSVTPPTPPIPEVFPMANTHEDTVKDLVALARSKGWRITESELVEKISLEIDSAELAQNVIAALGKMLNIDGADPQNVLDEITKRSAELEKVKGMLPQLQELLAEQVQAEETMVEEDVVEAMAAHRMPDTAKAALLTHRTGGIQLAIDVDARDPMPGIVKLSKAVADRRAQRTKFHTSYPQVSAEQQRLLNPLVTTPSPGAAAPHQLSGAHGQGGQPPAMPPAPLGARQGAEPAPWDVYPGTTPTLRAMAYLVDKHPNGKAMARDDVWKQACALVRQRAGGQDLH